MLRFFGIFKMTGFVFEKTNLIYNHDETCQYIFLNLLSLAFFNSAFLLSNLM